MCIRAWHIGTNKLCYVLVWLSVHTCIAPGVTLTVVLNLFVLKRTCDQPFVVVIEPS